MLNWQSHSVDSSQTSRSHSPRPNLSQDSSDQLKSDSQSELREGIPDKRVDSSQDTKLEQTISSLDSSLLDHLEQRPYPSAIGSDKKEQISPSYLPFRSSTVDIPTTIPSNNMPHRVDSFSMNSAHRRAHNPHYHNPHHRPSPPPIATLSHSPSLSVSSLDRSSVSTPPPRRSSPQSSMQSAVMYSAPYGSEASMLQPSRPLQNSHFSPRGSNLSQGYTYNNSYEQRYDSHEPSDNSSYHTLSHSIVPTMSHNPINSVRDNYGISYPLPGQGNFAVIHTSDAATKLSDRVRRRCFNCCTTDTSTWRRSNLSPGKVLCNKCGLFERTHSRPRPDQFPHKRGPLSTASLRARSPPTNHHLPPISTQVYSLPPYHHSHPSIAPLASPPDSRRYQASLPEIQSWLNDPSSNGHPAQAPTARRSLDQASIQHSRPTTPPARIQNDTLEARDGSGNHDTLA